MATVNPPYIERPKKSGHCVANIHDLEYIMAKKEYDNAPQVYGVHTTVISNPPVSQPAIEPMVICQSDGTVKHVLPAQQSIYADVRIHQQANLKTIIEMFPPGSICKIYLPDIDPYWAIINKIEFSTTHLEPALYIEFFKIEDILAMPDETSPDTLSQYPIIQSCVIYIPEQIERFNSSDAAEMSRELIKNEMNAIKKQIAALKDNLRQLNRLRNSGDSTSRLFSEIDRKYRAFVRNFRK